MSGIAIISNALSHVNKTRLDHLRRAAAGYPAVTHFELREMADLGGILTDIAALEPELLIINGGDGTVIAVATAIVNERPFSNVPPIAVLASGKTNMIAQDLGTGGEACRELAGIIALCEADRLAGFLQSRPLLSLDGADAPANSIGAFLGAAAIVRGIEFCRRRIYPLGMPNLMSHSLAIGVLIFLILWPFKGPQSPMRPARVHLVIDGKEHIEGDYVLIVATTLERMLLDIRLNPDNEDGDLRLWAIEYSVGALLRAAIGMMCRRLGKWRLKGVMVRRANSLTMDMNCPYTLDGELYNSRVGELVRIGDGKRLTFLRLAS